MENASNAARTCQPHYLRWKIHLLAPSFFPNPLIFIVSDSFFYPLIFQSLDFHIVLFLFLSLVFFYPLIFRSIFSNPGLCQLAPSRFFDRLIFTTFQGAAAAGRRPVEVRRPLGRGVELWLV